jgi:hypothetical protein
MIIMIMTMTSLTPMKCLTSTPMSSHKKSQKTAIGQTKRLDTIKMTNNNSNKNSHNHNNNSDNDRDNNNSNNNRDNSLQGTRVEQLALRNSLQKKQKKNNQRTTTT